MKKTISTYLVLCMMLALYSCQKIDRPVLGDYPKDIDVIPTTPLRFFVPFDSTETKDRQLNIRFADEISSYPCLFPDATIKSGAGVSGTSYQGADNVALRYLNANDMKTATSFTISLWMKQTVAEANGRTQFLFSFVDETYSWAKSAIFMMVEHATATDATVKVVVMDQWLEFANANNVDNKLKRPMFDGNWHHWVITYDEVTSKMGYYFDGIKVDNAPAAATDVKKDGAARGKLDLTKATSLVVGGYNRHGGAPGTSDDWMKSFTGGIDQFRMYNKVLSAAEVKELYDGKK